MTGFFGGMQGAFGSFDPQWEAFRVCAAIPIAGPWVQLALLPEEGRGGAWPPWLVTLGLLQLLGTGLLIVGIGFVVDRAAVTVLPSASADGGALSLTGAF